MDNKGDIKGARGENGALFGAQEMLPKDGEKEKFNEFLNQREDLKPKIEMPAELVDTDNSAETGGEAQPNERPASAVPVQDDKDNDAQRADEVKAQLEQIKVPRDAENLPKSYEKAVTDILNRNRKDPFHLVQEMDIARWKLMEKAFARKMGDGLNGGSV